ncbi:MAG: hypothetical protein IPM39_27035 [Chloroflexi bacterium]|nr:hypothetical protein [Chloroflexota bacterium]
MSSTKFSGLIPVLSAIPCIMIGVAINDPTVVLSAIVMEATTIQLSKSWGVLKEHWVRNSFLHEEIQDALNKSFLEAFDSFEKDFFQRSGRQPDRTSIQELCKVLKTQTRKNLSAGPLKLVDEGCFEAFLLSRFKPQATSGAVAALVKMVSDNWRDELSSHDSTFYDKFTKSILPLWQDCFYRNVIHKETLFRAYMLWQEAAQMEILRRLEDGDQRIEALIRQLLPGNIREGIKFTANLPKREEAFFFHSHDAVDALTSALRESRKVVLTGLPGAGKTITALKVAHNLHHDPGYSIFWVKAKSELQLLEEYARLAAIMGIDQRLPDKQIEEQLEDRRSLARTVKEAIGQYPRWLLVFDNMDDWFFKVAEDAQQTFTQYLDIFVPESESGRVLVTSCDRAEKIAQTKRFRNIEMGLMSAEDGARFLLQRAGLQNHAPELVGKEATGSTAGDQYWQDALMIASSLGGLPLALDQAAAVIKGMAGERFGFTLASYLQIFEAEKHSFVKFAKGDGAQESLFKSFSIGLKRLSDTQRPFAPHAIDLLKLCAFLSPANIPLPLLEIAYSLRNPAEHSDADVRAAIKEAYDARLLDFDAGQQVVSLHQIVQKVLWEMLLDDGSAVFWLRQTALVIARALDRGADWLPMLYPHIIALDGCLRQFEAMELIEDNFWEGLAGESNVARLQTIINDINVLRAIQNGARWEILLFGTEDPTYSDVAHSYSGWHTVQEPEWLERMEHMLASISRVCNPHRARNVFACVYLLTHYWWDFYLTGDNISEPLLDIWEKTHADAEDREYVRWLRQIGDTYPPERKFWLRESVQMRGNWMRVGKAATALKEALASDIPELEQDTPAYRYALSILNVYLAEAGSTYPKMNQEPDVDALALLEEAGSMLYQNGDSFHASWVIREVCETCLRLGKQYRSLATYRSGQRDTLLARSKELFERVQGEAQRGIGDAVEIAQRQEDVLDLEIIANFYRVLADVSWEKDKDGAATAVYHALAIFTAYVWLGEEWDVYSLEFLGEQVERFLAWLELVSTIEPDNLPDILTLTGRFWNGRSPTPDTLSHLLASGNLLQVLALLLPERPDKVETPGEPAAAYSAMRYNLVETTLRNLAALSQKHAPLTPIIAACQPALRQIKAQIDSAEA